MTDTKNWIPKIKVTWPQYRGEPICPRNMFRIVLAVMSIAAVVTGIAWGVLRLAGQEVTFESVMFSFAIGPLIFFLFVCGVWLRFWLSGRILIYDTPASDYSLTTVSPRPSDVYFILCVSYMYTSILGTIVFAAVTFLSLKILFALLAIVATVFVLFRIRARRRAQLITLQQLTGATRYDAT